MKIYPKSGRSKSNIETKINTFCFNEIEEFVVPGKSRSRSDNHVSQVPAPKPKRRKSLFKRFISFITTNPSRKSLLKPRVNPISVIMLLKKFIKLLKLSMLKKKMKNLTFIHYNVLNDKSCNPNHYVDLKKAIMLNTLNFQEKESFGEKTFLYFSNAVKKIFSKINVIIGLIPVFEANSYHKIAWDAFVMILLIINVINVPIELCFQLQKSDYNNYIYYLVDVFPGIFLCLDILVNMNTTFYSKGDYESNRQSIIRKYLKENLLLDAFTIIPFFIANYIPSASIAEITFIMRTVKLGKISKKFEDIMLLRDKSLAVSKFLKVIFLILFIANICGCIFHWVALKEIDFGFETTWLNNYGLIQKDWWIRYIYSLYWAVVTMITVGYGDITPITPIEKAVSILILLIGCGVFGYSINSVGTIMQELSEKGRRQRKQLTQFCYFMQKRKISRELQAEIRRYLEYKKAEDVKFNLEISNIFQTSLSSDLRKKFLYEIYSKHLEKFPILSKNFSKDVLKSLSLKIREQSFSPGDVIFEEGSTENRNLYFILRGDITLLVGPQKKIINTLSKNERFGALTFFNGDKHEMSAVSKNLTQIAILSYEDFFTTIVGKDKDFQIYRQIQDLLKQNPEKLKIFCPMCKKGDNHYVNQCPEISFHKYSQLAKQNYSQKCLTKSLIQAETNQECYRKSLFCRKSFRFRSLFRQNDVYLHMLEFIQKNDFSLDEFYYIQISKMNKDEIEESSSSSSSSSENEISAVKTSYRNRLIESIYRRQSKVELLIESPRNKNVKKDRLSIEIPKGSLTSSNKRFSFKAERKNEIFEVAKNFKNYFPESNIENVLHELNKARNEILSKRQNEIRKKNLNLLKFVSRDRIAKSPSKHRATHSNWSIEIFKEIKML